MRALNIENNDFYWFSWSSKTIPEMPLYGEAMLVTNFKRLMLSTRLVILLLFFASFLLSLVTAMFLQLGCKNR